MAVADTVATRRFTDYTSDKPSTQGDPEVTVILWSSGVDTKNLPPPRRENRTLTSISGQTNDSEKMCRVGTREEIIP